MDFEDKDYAGMFKVEWDNCIKFGLLPIKKVEKVLPPRVHLMYTVSSSKQMQFTAVLREHTRSQCGRSVLSLDHKYDRAKTVAPTSPSMDMPINLGT